MKPFIAAVFTSVIGAALLVACGGGASDPGSSTCGSPPPVALPELWLSYPEPSATAVPRSIGNVVFAYAGNPFQSDTVSITSTAGPVPASTFTAAPSPLPSPHATPANYGGNVTYLAVPVPTLAPMTTYTVSYTYTDWADNPPSCQTHVTQPLGTFTTE